MKLKLEIRIYGKVQGVFFRVSAMRKADKLGILGYVKNLPDGSVLILAQGERENLEIFLKWCATGPEEADVKKVDFVFLDNSDNKLTSFEIKK